MSTTRTVPALAAGLLGIATVIGPAPAGSARDTWTTTTDAVPDSTVVEFGEVIDIAVDVDSQGSDAPGAGTTTLYAREGASTTWRRVATSTASADFLDVRPRIRTAYKVVYGGHAPESPQQDTYERSESDPFTVEVSRTITRPKGGFTLKGRVRPRFARRTIIVKVSSEQDTGYRRFTTIRTDRRGRYRITLPRRTGTWYWSLVVRADANYLGTGYKWETWVS